MFNYMEAAFPLQMTGAMKGFSFFKRGGMRVCKTVPINFLILTLWLGTSMERSAESVSAEC